MADDLWSIPEVLRYRSEHTGDTKAFTFYDKDGVVSFLTFRDIYTLMGKFARCLHDWGFQPGDVIANGVPNSPERVVTDFGIMMAGCVSANCQVVEKDGSDVWNLASLSQCTAVILSPRPHDPVYQLFSPYLPSTGVCSGIHDVTVPEAPSITKVILCDRKENDTEHSFIDNLKHSDREMFNAGCSPSSLAVLFPTSGSSGFSKLVPETHERLLRSGRMFKAAESAVYYIDRPMGWSGGFPWDVLCHGTRRVVQDKLLNNHTSSPAAIWDIVTASGCTGAALLPGLLYRLVDHFENRPPDYKVLFITSSGQAMKKGLLDALGLLCHALIVSYGSTEGGMFSTCAVTKPSDFKDFYSGKVMDDVEVKIADGEGNALGYGKEGDIYLKSERLVKQYYNKSGDSSSTPRPSDMYTEDGWFKTGDRGYLHQDKSLFCYGRRGDVVSVGSVIIYLAWPETILSKCSSVQNACVLGIEEENGAAKLVACVLPKQRHSGLTEADVIEFFNGACMENVDNVEFKLSRVFIMEEFPILPSGKTNKRRLKEMVIKLLE